MFGAFAPCPIRLTAESATNGWAATQHARMCADVVAAWRAMPLAVMTVEVGASSVSLVSYDGRNGSGSAYAPTLTYTSATRPCLAEWEHAYEDDFGELLPWAIRHGRVSMHWAGADRDVSLRQIPGSTNIADVLVEAGATTPYRITITVHGDWGPDRQIGDYGGDLNKRDNVSESIEPYAAQWYREIRATRGSAYTAKPYTLVDLENVAISRMMAATFSRTPEKFSANATPAHADERLGYWVEVLGVPNKPDDPKWVLRQRAAAHYKSAIGPTLANVTAAISELLGDAFVAVHTYEGADLDNPPVPTYWPAGSPGPSNYSIGGPTWSSRRSHIRIEVQDPPGMPQAEFLQLMDVQLQQLMDRMLPAWVSWNWSRGSDGFQIGIDEIGIDAI